jgi:hypothetical protein
MSKEFDDALAEFRFELGDDGTLDTCIIVIHPDGYRHKISYSQEAMAEFRDEAGYFDIEGWREVYEEEAIETALNYREWQEGNDWKGF